MSYPTSSQIAQALQEIRAVAEIIRAAGSIPAGHLYADLMTRGCTLEQFDRIVGILTHDGAAVVEKRGDLLVWVGWPPTDEAPPECKSATLTPPATARYGAGE